MSRTYPCKRGDQAWNIWEFLTRVIVGFGICFVLVFLAPCNSGRAWGHVRSHAAPSALDLCRISISWHKLQNKYLKKVEHISKYFNVTKCGRMSFDSLDDQDQLRCKILFGRELLEERPNALVGDGPVAKSDTSNTHIMSWIEIHLTKNMAEFQFKSLVAPMYLPQTLPFLTFWPMQLEALLWWV